MLFRSTLRPDTPPGLASIVGKMLAKTPEARYQSPVDLTAALSRLAEQLGMGQPLLSSTPRVAGAPVWAPVLGRHLPWLIPAGLVGAGVVALALFWQPEEPPTHFEQERLSAAAENEIDEEYEQRGPLLPITEE